MYYFCYLTDFIAEPAQQMMSDVVPRVQFCSLVNMTLELKPIEYFLLHPLKLSSAS